MKTGTDEPIFVDCTLMKNRKGIHTSTLDAKNTHVGAINTQEKTFVMMDSIDFCLHGHI